MSVILHLFRWFFREHRLVIGFFLISLFATFISPFTPAYEWQQAVGAIALVAAGVFAVRLIFALNEKLPHVSDDSFWLSRPVTRRQVVIAQVLLIITVLAVPALLANLLTLSLLGGARPEFLYGIHLWLMLLGALFFLYTATVISSGSLKSIALLGAASMLAFGALLLMAYLMRDRILPANRLNVLLPFFGMLSLVIVFLPPFRWFQQRLAYLSFGVFAMLGIFVMGFESMRGNQNDASQFQVELRPKTPTEESANSSFLNFTHITNPAPDVILQPLTASFNLPSSKKLVLNYPVSGSGYAKDMGLDPRLVLDLILRQFPEGVELKATFQPDEVPGNAFYPNNDFLHAIGTSGHIREFEVTESTTAFMEARPFSLVRIPPMKLKLGESVSSDGCRYTISRLRRTGSYFGVGTNFAIAPTGKLFNDHGPPRGVRAWVLYSPAAQRAIITEVEELRIPDEAAGVGITMNRSYAKFPLPDTFTEHDDLELHIFHFEPGKLISLPVKVNPGKYSLIEKL